MSLHAITIAHMEPEIIAWSLMRFKRTTKIAPDRWIILDNKWPLKTENVRDCLIDIKHMLGMNAYTVIDSSTSVNLGGHGGVNHILTGYDFKQDDYILLYDPDSNPITDGWLEAMMEALDKDSTLAYVSLLPESLTDRPWIYKNSPKVAFLDRPEWWNVTLFRASILDKGLQSDADKWGATYYGHVEAAMFRYAREKGRVNGYLWDYREGKCPIDHPKAYTKWKQEHAYGKYPGNFDAYCKERGLK